MSIAISGGDTGTETRTAKYDVFLSHNSADKAAVEQIAVLLRDEGIRPFLDQWHIIPGELVEPGLTEALDASDCAAIFIGAASEGPWQNQEMQYALNKAIRTRDDYRVIPVLLPGADPQKIGGFLSLRSYVDLRSGLEDKRVLKALIAGVRGVAPDADAASNELPSEPRPYRGIARFGQAQHTFFFGRDGEIERLIAQLKIERFVAVIGASGSGKSSLVLAGLYTEAAERAAPGIRQWLRIRFTPEKDPLLQLATNLVAHLPEGERPALVEAFLKNFRAGDRGLSEALATLFPSRERTFLIVVDQFEELFSLRPTDERSLKTWHAQVKQLAANLLGAVDRGPSELRLVVTIRADFLDRFFSEDFPELRQLLERHQFWISAMSGDDIRDAIKRPAALRGAFLEKGLVERILSDMQGEAAALPLLEEALDLLWEHRSGIWLTHHAYDALGGVGGAIATKADHIFDSLSPPQRAIARRIMLQLVQLGDGVKDTRRRVRLSSIRSARDAPAEFAKVLETLSGSDARLISLSSESANPAANDAPERTAEVVHEALIYHWGRLAKWLQEEREALRLDRRLTESALAWDEETRKRGGNPRRLLWEGPELGIGLHYLADHQSSPSELQIRFLSASRRAVNSRRLLRGSLAALALIVVLGNVYVYFTAAPAQWTLVSQPAVVDVVGEEQRFLPVHEVAISRKDPNVILYFGRNPAWDHAKFSIAPRERNIPALSAIAAHLRATGRSDVISRIEFEILQGSAAVRGRGTVQISAALDSVDEVVFIRSMSFQGTTAERAGANTMQAVFPPRVLRDAADVFDLGEYAEYLASNDLLTPEDEIRGTIRDLGKGTAVSTEFVMDERLADGATSLTGAFGHQYTILSTEIPQSAASTAPSLEARRNDPQFWREIVASSDWASWKSPDTSHGSMMWTFEGPAAIVGQMPKTERPDLLVELLKAQPDWGEGGPELAEPTLHVTSTPEGRAAAVGMHWYDTPQGSGPLQDAGQLWMVWLGANAQWRKIDLPISDVEGIWSLAHGGQSALILTRAEGFYRTDNGGRSWQQANYNVNAFLNGSKVKPIIVGGGAVFVLIDRGTRADDGDNPLYRLDPLTPFERWRSGLVRFLQSP